MANHKHTHASSSPLSAEPFGAAQLRQKKRTKKRHKKKSQRKAPRIAAWGFS